MTAVSVVVPTMGRLGLLKQTLATLMDQTHDDLEIVVSLAGASEDTATRDHVLAQGDPRLRLVTIDQRVPHFANWNHAVANATGRYVALYHDDDLYHRDCVERCARFLDEHPRVGFVHAGARVIGDAGEDHGYRRAAGRDFVMPGRSAALRWIGASHDVVPSSTMLRRELYESLEPFDPQLYYADFDFYVRAAMVTDIGFLAGPLLKVRHHDTSVSWTLKPRRIVEECQLLVPRFRRCFEAAGVVPPMGWERVEAGLKRFHARRLCRVAVSAARRGDQQLGSEIREAILRLDGGPVTRSLVSAITLLNRPWARAVLEQARRRMRRKPCMLAEV